MKVLFLGIDALDRLLLEKFHDHLPNLSKLENAGRSLIISSTFPPDSDTAWATISTGLNPAQHGIVRFVDPLEKTYLLQNVPIDSTILRGKTFWEIIGRAGYKVCAIFPHLCYPVWEIPGVMVVRGITVKDAQAHPASILEYYPDETMLFGMRGLPDRTHTGMMAYAENLWKQARCDAEFALRLMQKDKWDLFFVYWSTIDSIGHFYWSFFDSDDPGYEEDHPLGGVILETYKLFDEIVGNFLESLSDDTTVIVMSDHGHGGRPYKLFNINELLRSAGLLKTRSFIANPHIRLLERVKRGAIQSMTHYGLGRLAAKALKTFPWAMSLFTRPPLINWDETIAYASDLSGIKSYTYGGIIINPKALKGMEYESLRSQIIELLEESCISPEGEPLVEFIARREELFSGPYITNYPEIVLELKYGYGLGWGVNTPLFTESISQSIVPGSHRGDTATFLIRSKKNFVRDSIDLHDITPTMLDLMGVTCDRKYDGRSIFK